MTESPRPRTRAGRARPRRRARAAGRATACLRAAAGAALALTPGLAGCGQPALLEELAPEEDCRQTVVVGPRTAAADTAVRTRLTVHWILPEQTRQLHQLNAWCAAVGPAVVGGWSPAAHAAAAAPAVAAATTGATGSEGSADPSAPVTPAPPAPAPPPADSARAAAAPGARGDRPAAGAAGAAAAPVREPVDSLAVVAWNVHVGGGALRRLVEDLRAGRLTGGAPVEHFVLLLQEAYRSGPAVPAFDADLPGGSGVEGGPPEGQRQDILRHAEALGLDVYYAPSMRSGEGEDRGNAILSTLPLGELVAIPLPVARQRRVAVAATVQDTTAAGVPWRLQVASVHLESDAAGFASDEAARFEQTRALLDALPAADAAVAAGDFNTRRRGPESELVFAMLDAYPQTPPFPPGPTYRRAWGLYRLYLDYMFFRLSDSASARYRRVPDPYGSDHYPLVGWVVFE